MSSAIDNSKSKLPKILLVDDREDNLISIEAVLGTDVYELYKAYSGSQALKILLTEFDFAMILMDVKMPVLNGFETATLIYERERLRQIPIIFITANNYGDENVFKGYQAGGIDYIFKPINPEVLRAKVSVFVDLYRKNSLLIEQEQKLTLANKKLEAEIAALKAAEEKTRMLNSKLLKDLAKLKSTLSASQVPKDT
jgi:response regulator RpfG family c-di-GMP phosphodiesterase